MLDRFGHPIFWRPDELGNLHRHLRRCPLEASQNGSGAGRRLIGRGSRLGTFGDGTPQATRSLLSSAVCSGLAIGPEPSLIGPSVGVEDFGVGP